jgi:hypothetical protein
MRRRSLEDEKSAKWSEIERELSQAMTEMGMDLETGGGGGGGGGGTSAFLRRRTQSCIGEPEPEPEVIFHDQNWISD